MISMASAERDAITGIWGQCPQRVSRGQSPLWGVRGEAPLKLQCLSAFACPKEAANLTNYYVQNCTNFDLELHKSIYNCSFCVELHIKKALVINSQLAFATVLLRI